MNEDRFEQYLKNFSPVEPEPFLREHVLRAVRNTESEQGWRKRLSLFLSSWRLETGLAALVAVLLLMTVWISQGVQVSSQGSRFAEQRAQELRTTANRLTAILGENGDLSEYIYRQLKVLSVYRLPEGELRVTPSVEERLFL